MLDPLQKKSRSLSSFFFGASNGGFKMRDFPPEFTLSL